MTIDGKYRLTIEDQDRNGAADHWELFVDGRLRVRMMAKRGYGEPEVVEVYDENGKLVRHKVTFYEGSPSRKDGDESSSAASETE